MKKVVDALGNDSCYFLFDDEKGTLYSINGEKRKDFWVVSFEYETNKKMSVDYKCELLINCLDKFFMCFNSIKNLNINIKGALGDIPKKVSEKYNFKIKTIQKIDEQFLNYTIFLKSVKNEN